MKDIVAVILAAGRGTRMKSDTPKVLQEILGKPIIHYVLDCLKTAGINDAITVSGYGSELLKKALPRKVRIVLQKRLLGSGDAVNAAKKVLNRYSGDLLVICGDTPLIRSKTVKGLIERHKATKASLTILTAKVKDPASYGRIVRSKSGEILRIAEDEEADFDERAINEVNVGTYCFDSKELFQALAGVSPDNKKKELFLTDTVGILHDKSRRIESVLIEDPAEMIGVNTRKDLSEALCTLKNRVLDELMSSGVTIEDPLSTMIYPGVRVGRDTVIRPNTLIESRVEIGRDCEIGPFAHIRPDVRIGDNVEIGNFVELVRTTIKEGTKVKHHTYLGDAAVGRKVNIGAGTITANFDGKKKNKTIIEDNAFIGVGAILIAPVKVGKGALVGAGSVVPKNHNVPSGATVMGVPARVMRNKRSKT